MTTLLQDVRYALRTLLRSPSFTGVALLSLALGIGATTAIYSVVHAVLLRPLPYQEPDRLVKVWETHPHGNARNPVSSGNYLAWRERASSFEELGAHSGRIDLALTGDGAPMRVRAVRITAAAMRVLGVPALHGRVFTPDEAEPGGPPVALVSHSLWRLRFGGDTDVVGRTITLNDTPVTIVGIMPPDFDYPDAETQIWYPLRFDAEDREARRSHQWNVLGRLRPGIDLARAQSEMDAIATAIAAEHPEYMTGWGVNVRPLRDDLVGEARPLLLVVFGVVGLVLLIACANLANLLLARALAREREIAIRGALGASRGRLVRQLLTESGVLAVLGGGLGLTAVVVGSDALVAFAPADLPLLDDVRVSGPVFAFAAGLTLVVGLLFGLAPALRLAGRGSRSALANGTNRGGLRHGRLRGALIVGEVALSLVLLVGAGLLARSFARMNAQDYGFDPRGVLTIGLDLPYSRYESHEAQAAFYERLLGRLRALPGVESAGATTEPPIVGFGNTFSFVIADRPAASATGREDDELLHAVLPGYFRAMRMPLVRGRVIDEADRAGSSRAMVINQALADKHWPGVDPIGARIAFVADGPWFEIVGVVGDTRHEGLDQPIRPQLFMAYAQKPWGWMSWQTLTLRAAPGQDAGGLTRSVRAAVAELDDALPLLRVATMAELHAGSTARRRFAMTLVGMFAALALLLGAVGLFGVVAYAVAQRRREIGVRVALGAREAEVVRLVLRDGMRLAALGVALGLIAALALTRVLSSLLYGVTATDPTTFAGVALLLGGVAFLASWIPALRAARLDPMAALRAD